MVANAETTSMSQRRHRPLWLAVLALLIAVPVLMALLPVQPRSREQLFEIPKGTWARRMAGDQVEILPDSIYLTLGVNDVLVLKNRDDVPQIFGPTLIMPGQSFTLPFDVAADYPFACSAHVSGQMTVIVEPEPTPGWARLLWRGKKWWRAWRSWLP